MLLIGSGPAFGVALQRGSTVAGVVTQRTISGQANLYRRWRLGHLASWMEKDKHEDAGAWDLICTGHWEQLAADEES